MPHGPISFIPAFHRYTGQELEQCMGVYLIIMQIKAAIDGHVTFHSNNIW